MTDAEKIETLTRRVKDLERTLGCLFEALMPDVPYDDTDMPFNDRTGQYDRPEPLTPALRYAAVRDSQDFSDVKDTIIRIVSDRMKRAF